MTPLPIQLQNAVSQLIRKEDMHKGDFGRVVLIGGSVGMSGAISLAGLSALRSGAGLVYLCIPKSILPIVAGFNPNYITVPLPEDEHGRIDVSLADPILTEKLSQADCIGIGPGLGQSESLKSLVKSLFLECDKPIVFDADALNLLSPFSYPEDMPNADRILTPHPGEFSRLTGKTTQEIQSNRASLAIEFARRSHCITLLKGNQTIVSNGTETEASVYRNSTGNPGMGTGGSGDVLTGMVCALIGQKLSSVEATQLACFLHGLAGDLASEKLGEHSLIATDLIEYLPRAFQSVIS